MSIIKVCNGCGNEYEYYGIKHKLCRECKKEYDREYHKNKSVEKKLRKNELQNIRRTKNRLWLYNYLLKNPCIICNEKDPVVLDFDHIDKDKKEFGISENIGLSLEKIKKEVEKCQILCANCHRRRTAEQFGWYKFLDE